MGVPELRDELHDYIRKADEDSLMKIYELIQKIHEACDDTDELNEPEFSSYALPGDPLSDDEFKKWIEHAEDSQSVNFSEAKSQWADQKKNLRKLIR
ncbi:hypothetical protein EYV94_21075 [Puteibacter caeruleilacunae]|nr:hypothetical protein EYV94_21075 [Puteibacter caeruleilacunae]